jgi:hypothetical protein
MKKCILKLLFENDLYDEITDCLLSFPERELEFMGYEVQSHTKSLDDIREQVSGFKLNMVIEITTDENEAKSIYRYLKQALPQAQFEGQLIPLLDFNS